MLELRLSEGEGCLAWSLVFSTFMLNVLRTCFTGNLGLILPSIKETFLLNNTAASLANSLLAFLALGSHLGLADPQAGTQAEWTTLVLSDIHC